jgi:hypothetical protein
MKADKYAVAEGIRSYKHQGMSEPDAVMASMRNKGFKKSKSPLAGMSSPSAHEEYPYSLRMDLDHETLGKLGMTELPDVGSQVRIHAKAKVHSVSEDARDGEDGGKPRRRASLQITHMKVGV